MPARSARRRRWNNLLILGVIVFIGVLNLPTIIKTYLIPQQEQSTYPYLLNPELKLQALYFSDWSLELDQGQWHSSHTSNVDLEELATRWKSLVGTKVDSQTYDSLKQTLNAPESIEVWYQDQEEPQRITWYRTPQFWLLNNWQGQWIAISTDEQYLIPYSL